MEKNSPEYQAGSTLIDEGIEFQIDGFWGKKITLNVKPQKGGSIVRISRKALKLKQPQQTTIQEFMTLGENVDVIAEIIAIALVNQEILKRWKYLWYKWLMLNKVKDLEYLYSFLLLVQRQMGPVFFYLIMNLTPAMNHLMKRENPKAAKPFGEQSQSSKKHSDSPTNK